jgi:hypothetical protein
LRSNFGPWTSDLGLPCLELGCGSGLVGLACLAAGLEVTFSDYVPFTVELALENAARNGFANARGLVLDWRQPHDRQWPLIVAADVTYDRTNIAPLLDVLEKMLAVWRRRPRTSGGIRRPSAPARLVGFAVRRPGSAGCRRGARQIPAHRVSEVR